MTINLDLSIVLTGVFGFLVFIILHFISSRFMKAEHLFKGIIITFMLGLLSEVILLSVILHSFQFLSFIMSVLIYSFSALFYVLCFFGPFETSIRMRLIRELASKPEGLTKQEIYARYNERIMLDTRLKRLIGSGDVKVDRGNYTLVKNHNAFFMLDLLAERLHGFITKN